MCTLLPVSSVNFQCYTNVVLAHDQCDGGGGECKLALYCVDFRKVKLSIPYWQVEIDDADRDGRSLQSVTGK